MVVDQTFFLDIISGRRNGLTADVLRACLGCCEPFYSFGSQFKNLFYDKQWLAPKRVSIPVIAIGNLTTGGTGKTPTVAWLVQWLQQQGFAPAIVSRGYRSLDGQANDEKLLLDQLCPNVPHVQNRDRVAAADKIVALHDCDVIVLDDGFQHRRLHRNVDLVLIDALNPWGYDHLLPRGLLREPISNLRRANAVLLTRTDQVTKHDLAKIEKRIAGVTDAPIAPSHFQAISLTNFSGEKIALETLREKRVCAFAAVGHPGGFRRTLVSNGFGIDDDRFWIFPDHHHYSAKDHRGLETWALRQNATCLLTTRKDLVKIGNARIGGMPVWAIDIELKISHAQDQLTEMILSRLTDFQSTARPSK